MTSIRSNSNHLPLFSLLRNITSAELFGGLTATTLLAVPTDRNAIALRDRIYRRRKAEYPLHTALSHYYERSSALWENDSETTINIGGMLALVESVINIAETLDSQGADEDLRRYLHRASRLDIYGTGHIDPENAKPLLVGAKRLHGLRAHLRNISFQEYMKAVTDTAAVLSEEREGDDLRKRCYDLFPFFDLLDQLYTGEASHNGPASLEALHCSAMLDAGYAMAQLARTSEPGGKTSDVGTAGASSKDPDSR